MKAAITDFIVSPMQWGVKEDLRMNLDMKYKPKTLSPVQVAQVVKALLLLGEEHITIETVEKDRYAITTKRNGPNPKEKN